MISKSPSHSLGGIGALNSSSMVQQSIWFVVHDSADCRLTADERRMAGRSFWRTEETVIVGEGMRSRIALGGCISSSKAPCKRASTVDGRSMSISMDSFMGVQNSVGCRLRGGVNRELLNIPPCLFFRVLPCQIYKWFTQSYNTCPPPSCIFNTARNLSPLPPGCTDTPTNLRRGSHSFCSDPTDIMGIWDKNLFGRRRGPPHLYSGVLGNAAWEKSRAAT